MGLIPPGELRYGMQLPMVSQSPYFAQDWEKTAGPQEMELIARAADRAGFFYLGVCDHVAIPKAAVSYLSAEWYDPVATLGWLGGFTTQVRLLSHVYVAAYRNPLLTASSFGSLDRLSGGRVILGVGAGHLREEFAALGVAYEERGALTDEALEVIRAAWAGEYFSAHTPHWTFADLAVAPRPEHAIPIWIGGSSRAALRRAARLGDGWLPEGTPLDQLPPLIDYLRSERDRCRPTEPLDIGAGVSVRIGEPRDSDQPGWVTGSCDQVIEGLTSVAALGANHLQVKFPTDDISEQVDQVQRFGEEVGPQLVGR